MKNILYAFVMVDPQIKPLIFVNHIQNNILMLNYINVIGLIVKDINIKFKGVTIDLIL